MLEAAQQFISNWPLETVVAGGFGAFFGALGAQLIISRFQNREAVTAELNSVATAQTLCFSICNVFLALKNQHVRPMEQRYDAVNAAHNVFVEQRQRGRQTVFKYEADLQTLPPVKTPHTLLENIFLERVQVRGRALAAAIQLIAAIDGLEKSIIHRNQLISDFRAKKLSDDTRLALYLGLETGHGIVDERFPQCLRAIVMQTDDCIFFSRLVAEDLEKHGRHLRHQHAWRMRFGLPKPVKIDWKVAEEKKLLPSEDDYKDWMHAFATPQSWFASTIRWLKTRLSWPRLEERKS